MAKYNAEGMLECPPHMSERWFKKLVARKEVTEINGQCFTMQSVPPRWYFETNDACGMSSDRKDTARYIDLMLKNCIIDPPEIKKQGIGYFDERGDIDTPEKLLGRLERFLRPGAQPTGSSEESQS